MSSANAAHLLALVDLIQQSVKVVIDQYAAAGRPVPSLDSTSSDPFDAPEATPPALADAVRTIEAACAQLSYTVASPGHVLANKAFSHYEISCLGVVCDAKISDLLLDKPEGVHVSELSKQTGIEQGKLGRVLRLLATKHCYNEVKPNVFANNRLSIRLLSTDPVSGLVGHGSDELMKASPFLSEVLSDPAVAASYSVNDTAFVRAHHGGAFEFFRNPKPENEKRAARIGQAMIGWGMVTGAGMLPQVYPWGDLPRDTTICDVGGGNGHATLELAKVYPGLKIVLQDVPNVVEEGKELWAREYPQAIQDSRVDFVPLDFFKESPVNNCDFYYIRHVLHDWPDADCVKILTSIRTAMGPSSRLLIHEHILQHVSRQDPSAALPGTAPPPLLPNYGMANARPYHQDLNMLSLFNSQERTAEQFIDLGSKVGLKFVEVWGSGETALVEFTLP